MRIFRNQLCCQWCVVVSNYDVVTDYFSDGLFEQEVPLGVKAMKLVCISDIHNYLSKVDLPEGDVLVISGDVSGKGSIAEISRFNHDLGEQRHKYKYVVMIAGNHDFLFEKDLYLAKSLIPNVSHYLQDELAVIDGVRFYGSPWQPRFYDWAFNLDRGAPLKAKWDMVPDGVDVLITHGPPQGILDVSSRGEHIGCQDLLDAVLRIKPKVHIFGHNHHGYGQQKFHGIDFINACSCDERYKPFNKPIEIKV
jgi:Icc-related predicted phosphoesterase